MEGPSLRMFPRMLLDKPVELQVGGDTIRIENSPSNLSMGGLFVRRGDLPVGTPVHVRIKGSRFEADGQIRHVEPDGSGAGIGFNDLNGNRQALYDLIKELTERGLPAA